MKLSFLTALLLLLLHHGTLGQQVTNNAPLKFNQSNFSNLKLGQSIYSYQEITFTNTTDQKLFLDNINIDNSNYKILDVRLASNNRVKDTLYSQEKYRAFIKWSTWDKSGPFDDTLHITFRFKNHADIEQNIYLKGYVTETPKIEFETLKLDADTIPEGGPYIFEFKFKNIGTQEVFIKNVRSSCGCLIPTWPKKPILPGETGIIEGKYLTKGRRAYFYKSMTIESNA